MKYTKDQLKFFTISHTLFRPVSLKKAIENLTFVQIDPIKSPAVAQDLILRHRVTDYHKGDIDARASKLDLEEDFLYAHGYMTQDIWQLLHPRGKVELNAFDRKVFETVRNLKEIHPKELDSHFDKKLERNWWGGNSRSSKMALDRLHYYGLLRVVRRESGLRVYEALTREQVHMPDKERLKKIILVMIHIMQPVVATTLSQSMHRIHRHFGNTRPFIKELLDSGELEQQKIDSIVYLWKGGTKFKNEVCESVKFLAPFDPVVRDRLRFEHLWGWLYQFEAYVPSKKRIRGYYAMPLLWIDEVIGWVNIKKAVGRISIDLGFINGRPKDKKFNSELDAEIERMKKFLF